MGPRVRQQQGGCDVRMKRHEELCCTPKYNLNICGEISEHTLFFSFFLLRHAMHCITLRHGDCQSFFLCISWWPHIAMWPLSSQGVSYSLWSQREIAWIPGEKDYYFKNKSQGLLLLLMAQMDSNFSLVLISFLQNQKGRRKVSVYQCFYVLFYGEGVIPFPWHFTNDSRAMLWGEKMYNYHYLSQITLLRTNI